MIKIYKPALLFLALCVMLFTACKKKSSNPIDQLPPITQTGANTFGCLINGEVFVPKKKAGSLAISLQCYYQYLFEDFNPIKGYFFGLSADDMTREPRYGVNINSTNKAISVGEFDLETKGIEGTVYAEFVKYGFSVGMDEYVIKNTNKGKLKITRFDEVNQIVSGTFWFDAVNEQGEKVEIREGRFDMKYTR